MNHEPKDTRAKALDPLASLISKSEKAQQKLKPGTWQHSMLAKNLKALRFVIAQLKGEAAEAFTRDELAEALLAMREMIGRSENTQTKFAPGTSQHSLQQNRLQALRLAEALIEQKLELSE